MSGPIRPDGEEMLPANASATLHETVPVYVVESGRRWRDTACRFLGRTRNETEDRVESMSDNSESLFQVQRGEINRLRAAMAGTHRAIVFWEVTPENASVTALTIAQLDVGRSNVLQFASVDAETDDERAALERSVRELGVSMLVEGPEQFPLLARLIGRWVRPRD